MRRFLLGSDNKPCIWPIPEDCTWNGERYEINNGFSVHTVDEFIKETEILVDTLVNDYSFNATITNEKADLEIMKCDIDETGAEGYFLNVTETGVILKAGTRNGIFYGCQTLLQLITNSPDNSIHGVYIADKPLKPIRGVCTNLPDKVNISEFKSFISFLAKYKVNRIILKEALSDNYIKQEEINGLIKYANDRHIEVIPQLQALSNFDEVVSMENEDRHACLETLIAKIYKILKFSCILWWNGYKADGTAVGCLMPDYMERIVAQLYPFERDRISGTVYPSCINRNYKTLDLRKFYNAPLSRIDWKPDDYDFMYLADAENLPNTAPFSILQGVTDIRLQSALILAGNGWNQGIKDIPVDTKLSSLVFLHSYIVDGEYVTDNSYTYDKICVGYYVIYFKDGKVEKVNIEYGKTIYYWRTDYKSNNVAYLANPVFKGFTQHNDSYTVYSQEWINTRPDIEVVKIEIIPEKGTEKGGIAIMGITVIN